MAERSAKGRFFPPYYKYPVFAFCGFELLLTACILAISEAYYKKGSIILPISYEMFQDTLDKHVPGFTWNNDMRALLESYRFKLMCLWAVSAVGVTISMLFIIPQFFDYNDARGNRSQLCLVRKKVGLILTIMMAIFVVVLGITIIWAWYDCRTAAMLFHEKFDGCEKEEIYLTKLEERLHCVLDDDREVPAVERCYFQAKASFLNPHWMDAILGAYLIGHALMILTLPLLNRQLLPDDDEDSLYGNEEKEHIEV
ncbi:unnamed protein product, partial [Mesorhabditis spiculigera]